MAKNVNCTHYKWGVDPVIIGNLYEFPEPITTTSTANYLGRKDNSPTERTFSVGRLMSVNEMGNVFNGHKIPINGFKKNKHHAYQFVLP